MIFRTVTLSLLALTLSACNMSGTGEKGPFDTGSGVTLKRLNAQASPIESGTLSTRTTSKTARYTFRNIRWNGWAELTISGNYFNELTASISSNEMTLNAITSKNRTFDTANVHLYSHLAAARIKQRVAGGEGLSLAWKNTQLEMKQIFGLEQVSTNLNKGVEQLRLTNGSGRYRKDNANLLLFTGSFLASGGDSDALNTLTQDFADDGEINGASIEFFNSIALMGATDGFIGELSNNLRNYGVRNPPNSGDLPQLPSWVNQNPVDTVAPVITVTGDNPVTVYVGTAYNDAGATAIDDVDGAVTAAATNNSDVIDTSIVATHTVTYSATDVAGNISTATRTVNVVNAPDTEAPVITLVNGNSQTLDVYTAGGTTPQYQDPGYTVTDNRDANVAVNVSGTVNMGVVGSYELTYSAADTAGNSTSVVRTVNIVDRTAPVITLNGDASIEIYQGFAYTDQGASALDAYEGNLSVAVTGSVNTEVLGEYSLVYTATDTSGNSASVTRNVTVVAVPDITAPVITVTGDNPATVYVGASYIDAGATAVDDVDGTVTAAATNNSDVIDTSVVATHTVTYSATDATGNTSTATRTVNVLADTVAPVLTLLGDSPIDVEAGVTYIDAGATAFDNIDGDITSNIVVALDEVNIYRPDTYTLIYNVKDAANNEATPIQRIVTVKDTIAPVLTLRGPSTVVVNHEETYIDEGAIAIDSFEGNISGSIMTVNPVDTSIPATYTVTYNVSDTSGHAAEEITRTVRVNTLPIANAGADVSVLSGETVTLTGTGSDAEGTVTYRWKNDDNTVLSTSATYTFTARNTETLTFEVEDNDGAVTTDTVTVTVTVAANQAPVVENQHKYIYENTQNNSIELLATDPDGDAITFTYSQPEHGTVTGTGSSLLYTPARNYVGGDVFLFTASDGVDSSSAQVSIIVKTNTAPVATPQNVTVEENSFNNSITLEGTDADGDALTYAISSQPAHGTLSISGPHVLYTPDNGYFGSDVFTFRVDDGVDASPVVSVNITVNEYVGSVTHIVLSQDPLYLPVGFNVGSLYDEIINKSFIVSGSGNLLTMYADGYWLDANHSISSDNLSAPGTYYATVKLFDSFENLIEEKVLTINVTADTSLLNDSPTIGQLSDQNIALNQTTIIGDNSPSVIDDQDGEIVSYQWTENNVVISNTLAFDYTPTTLGEHLLTLTVTDDKGAIAIGTKTINVMFSSACHATPTSEAAYVDNFIVNKVADTPWPSNLNNVSLTVADIASVFNAARPNGEYQIGQTFVMPTQTVWDNYSDSEKALYLINAERCARGIRPYEGISETVVTDTAQYYADYLASNNVFGHNEDGRSPWERLNQLSGVTVNGGSGNADFFSRAENLAMNSLGSTGAFPTVHEPVTKAVYAWMYNDKEATRQGAAAPYTYTYGHREFILAKGLNDNFGEPNKEGLIGIATSSAQETVNGFNWTKVYTVMNGFDPNENWTPNTPIIKVDYIAPTACAGPFYAEEIRTNSEGVSYLACIPQT